MKRREFLKKIIVMALAGGALRSKAATTTEKAECNKHLNVLFIAVDDMNDWMAGLRPSTSGIYNNGQWWKPHIQIKKRYYAASSNTMSSPLSIPDAQGGTLTADTTCSEWKTSRRRLRT